MSIRFLNDILGSKTALLQVPFSYFIYFPQSGFGSGSGCPNISCILCSSGSIFFCSFAAFYIFHSFFKYFFRYHYASIFSKTRTFLLFFKFMIWHFNISPRVRFSKRVNAFGIFNSKEESLLDCCILLNSNVIFHSYLEYETYLFL